MKRDRLLQKAEQERRWLEENREAIETYNLRVARHGILSDGTGLLDTSSVNLKDDSSESE
jgi:Post-segregation antitoxin CcdA